MGLSKYATLIGLLLAANPLTTGAEAQGNSSKAPPTAITAKGLNWYAVLLAGSDEHPVFDRFVTDFQKTLKDGGVSATAYKAEGAPVEGQPGGSFNPRNLLAKAPSGEQSACLLYVTSHGNPEGFVEYVKDPRNLGILTAGDLAVMADQVCGERPAAIVISACFGASMVTQSLRKPNRVILAAARPDRSSFGCSFEETYNYFDGCILQNWSDSATWTVLFDRAKECISRREGPRRDASEPQIFVGSAAKNLPVPHP
ncbi:C13 family peptidase [Lacibacterium aquatile]|uniref:C13 family peptidase n=1 Tax=Lacibacterium aquatile TaxID=1168082 RepID=A0ABW5DW88_9PROT